MWVGNKQNFIETAGVDGSHSDLSVFLVCMCFHVMFHTVDISFGMFVTLKATHRGGLQEFLFDALS